ncbi:branched-chain amino acid transport system II carrier protein [Photobacterium sp. TY1-4]|uniref:branched-chain amino acid transport system II carrier protein n=1 Tax=Photobacterium sp. TY1-4 TaxID=2899122 RepID=UPI0021C236C1|nr:branched-chain amino acid transport system II carrier protein [Photobacterium sp. TY1-4]UXI04370.1 branched-chain amino acid transport system II carrier protein [Photobacterium sp. TY1-4]
MKKRDITAIGFTTFALFLGAGNLIFPPMMAQNAGEQWLLAMAGFLISAVGLPALTIVVLGRLSATDKLTRALPDWLGKTFWLAVFFTLGPAFVLPRAVNVAYEMGIKPFTSTDLLLPFSVLFCALSLFLAIKPGKIVDIIGKFMTPGLIIMLSILVVAALFDPQGTTTSAREDYQATPLTQGLLEGYMTLDAIAAVAFGWVIIQAIKAKGVHTPAKIRQYSYIIAGIYILLMSGCYLAMGYLGATSSTIASNATNGGMILTRYAAAVLGPQGQSLLAIITLTACLTTMVGLTNANAEYFRQSYRLKFNRVAAVVTILTALVSNIGLEQLIAFSLPLILTLCPVAISLILAACFPSANNAALKYLVYTAILFGSLDTLSVLKMMPQACDMGLQQWLPLYTQHLSWLLPSFLVLAALALRHKRAVIRKRTVISKSTLPSQASIRS